MTEKEYEALYDALEAASKVLEEDNSGDEKDADLRKKIRKLEKAVRKRQKTIAKSKTGNKDQGWLWADWTAPDRLLRVELTDLGYLLVWRPSVDMIAVGSKEQKVHTSDYLRKGIVLLPADPVACEKAALWLRQPAHNPCQRVTAGGKPQARLLR